MTEKKTTTIYRVTYSPWDPDEDMPWDYEEDGFIAWVDEVFLEGYKEGEDAPFPTAEECVDILLSNGYEVEVVEE